MKNTKRNFTEIKNKIAQLKAFLREEFFVTNIKAFGSFVRDEANQNSDLDLLVELEKPLGFKFFELQNMLEKELEIKIDLGTVNSLKPYIRQQILNEAIDL